MTLLWFNDRIPADPPVPADRPAGGLVVFAASASTAAALVGFVAGWPLWALVLVALLPWLPAFVADVTWTGRRFGALALFYVLVVSQVGHFLEHLAQVVQIHLLGLSGSQARGIFGQLDLEWVHFAWNTWVIVAALLLVARYPRNRWLWVLTVAAVWHEAEHAYLVAVYHTTGQAGTPGLLATGGLLGGGLPLARPDLHFLYNLVETVPLIVAFAIEVHRASSPDPGEAGDPTQVAEASEPAPGATNSAEVVPAEPASRRDAPFLRPLRPGGRLPSGERGAP